MTAVAKTETLPVANVTIRRFVLPDLNDKGPWLLGRLQLKYPALQDKQFAGWLRGKVDSSEVLFIRTEHAVALAEIVHESLSSQPTVIERFVLVEDKTNDDQLAEAVALYKDIQRWALGLGAAEIRVDVFSDVPKALIKDTLGRIFIREEMFARVGR